jgi:succinate dehydrogenase subunit C
MSAGAHYTPYHPKWYRKRVSVWWWLESGSYTGFVLRELSAVAVAFFAAVLIAQIRALAGGPEAYARFTAVLASPPVLVLSVIAFLFVLFHAVTWFNLAPTAMVIRVRGKRVPDGAISGSNYAAWVVLSAVVAFLMLRS